ncbi:MAG: Crp/Fnr family transcriptional regulator [Pseudomonadota bacterium]
MGCEDLSRHLHVAFNQHALNFKKNSTLLLERDECQVVYCVIDGWLALSKALDGGQNQIIDFALPGDIVDPAAADGLSSSVTITALTNGLLAAMPYRSWEKMTCDWPDLQRAAYLVEAAKGARRAERMLRLGKGTAEMRIAYALLEFCIRLDLVCESEIPEFHIPLTQQQLGDYVGLSSVHVCRTMRRMTRNGILEMRNHMDIRVLDSRMLARLAGVDRAVLKREIVPIRV